MYQLWPPTVGTHWGFPARGDGAPLTAGRQRRQTAPRSSGDGPREGEDKHLVRMGFPALAGMDPYSMSGAVVGLLYPPH